VGGIDELDDSPQAARTPEARMQELRDSLNARVIWPNDAAEARDLSAKMEASLASGEEAFVRTQAALSDWVLPRDPVRRIDPGPPPLVSEDMDGVSEYHSAASPRSSPQSQQSRFGLADSIRSFWSDRESFQSARIAETD
jgi:hypothetical protein